MGEKVLVTGGAGYIGSHTCKALAEAGYEPVAIDNLIYGHRRAVKWGPLEVIDVGDPLGMSNIFKKYQPIGVLHFAGFTYVGESVLEPSKYYINNLSKTTILLDTMLNYGVKNFVFSSTCATYGDPIEIPITETHLQKPINPYGWSKLMVETMLKDYAKAYNLNATCLRYFNAAGAEPEGQIGEDHNPETHLIPLILDAVLGKRTSITIFGTDYPTPDGTCIRDYIHVTDLADAHVKAFKWMYQFDGGFHAFNLGNGQGFSVKEVIDSVQTVTGAKVNIVEGKRRLGDPPILVGSSHLAQKMLDWQPSYTDIKKIIEHAWNFHRRNKGRCE